MKVLFSRLVRILAAFVLGTLVLFNPLQLVADGLLKAPRDYEGSLEERSQEAIIVMTADGETATEDLILKISVDGDVDQFAWVIPFPNQPKVNKADAALFKELYDYVKERIQTQRKTKSKKFMGMGGFGAAEAVDVLSREIVGSYDVSVVRENVAGTLNQWLEKEGYQPIENGEDVLEFYRKKDYVFACVKVSEAELKAGTSTDLHPLRFTFLTGGRDGIYFPMKLSGLQNMGFSVNLYVFYPAWLNDTLNRFGYEKRGFHRKYRDWDGPRCEPNAGKLWSDPSADPFLRDMADGIPTVAKLFADLYPEERFYLTNIQTIIYEPATIRAWPEDLWLFPYYTKQRFIPYDVRPGGPAEGWADVR